MMRKRRTIPLRQIAPQQAASHRTPRSDNHHRNARRDPASEVGKQEDRNSRIHKNRKHNSQNALRHAQPPGTSPSPNQPPRLRCRSPFHGFFQGPQYRTSYSSWMQLGHLFCEILDRASSQRTAKMVDILRKLTENASSSSQSETPRPARTPETPKDGLTRKKPRSIPRTPCASPNSPACAP
jgi:hypothetical protein